MLHPSEVILSNFFQLLKQAASMLHPFKWKRCLVTLQFGAQQSEIGLAGHCQEWEGLPSILPASLGRCNGLDACILPKFMC